MITYVFICQGDIRCYTVTRVKDCILDHQITILYDCIIDHLLRHQQVGLSRKGCGCCRDKKKNGLERKAVGFLWYRLESGKVAEACMDFACGHVARAATKTCSCNGVLNLTEPNATLSATREERN